MNKKIVKYKLYEEPPIIGERCKLVLSDGTIVRTSKVVNLYGSTIETLNTIYEKQINLNLHSMSYEDKLKTAKSLKIIN